MNNDDLHLIFDMCVCVYVYCVNRIFHPETGLASKHRKKTVTIFLWGLGCEKFGELKSFILPINQLFPATRTHSLRYTRTI